jgi:hypothetical protein
MSKEKYFVHKCTIRGDRIFQKRDFAQRPTMARTAKVKSSGEKRGRDGITMLAIFGLGGGAETWGTI